MAKRTALLFRKRALDLQSHGDLGHFWSRLFIPEHQEKEINRIIVKCKARVAACLGQLVSLARSLLGPTRVFSSQLARANSCL